MTRYAIYFVPSPDGVFAAFGTRAIGYDVSTGAPVPFHDDAAFRALAPEKWSESPARYGFHATLMAPFKLADGESEAGLVEAVDHLAGRLWAVDLGHLAVRELGRFLALTPKGPTTAIDQLAVSCVITLEPFRAPLAPADLSRRLAAPLTPRQSGYVEQFGYPYVLDEFRFHMTLTGPIPDENRRAKARTALAALYQPLDRPQCVDALTICRQPDRDGPFRVLSRHPLLSAG